MQVADVIGNESYNHSEFLSSHSSPFRVISASGGSELYQNKLKFYGCLRMAIMAILLPQKAPKLHKMDGKRVLRQNYINFTQFENFPESGHTSMSRTGHLSRTGHSDFHVICRKFEQLENSLFHVGRTIVLTSI